MTSYKKIKIYFFNYYRYIFYFLSFIVPFLIFLRTMNPTSFGFDTTWFHIQVPLLYVGQTTGFPLAFLTGKLFSFIPVGTMAYRLNMYSVVWGAMTVLILFIFIKNLLKNEYYIALVSSIFFVLFRVFWFQTNRFEVYTLQTFLISLIMLVGFYWSNNKKNKFLYLYYFLIGLSFTNHPISLFLSPAFILFPIYTDWKEVFRIKKIFIILLLIIAPNLLYLYIPIRSLQGYGNITTFHKFVDYISGQNWKNEFGFTSFASIKKIFFAYFNFLKGDFTILVGIVILIGIIYLAIKQKKLLIFFISLIIMNFVPILMYKLTNDFYLASLVIFLSILFAYGIYAVKEGIVFLYNKYIKKFIENREKNKIKTADNSGKPDFKKITIRSLFLFIFFLAISFFPVNIFASNFKSMDASKGTYVHDYWYNIISSMENNSILYSNSLTTHVSIYILKFEVKKDIKIVRGINLDDLRKIVKENLGKNNIYYSDLYLPDLSQYYDVEIIGQRFYQEGSKENFFIYKINGIKVNVEIVADRSTITSKFGEKVKITYYIKNHSKNILNMNSIELKLPKIVKFVDMDPSGNMKVFPGMARGSYMWTNGPYIVKPGDQFILSFIIQSSIKGEDSIIFRITTGNMFVDGPRIKIKIE